MKKLSALLVVPALLLGACTPQPPVDDGMSSSSSSSSIASSVSSVAAIPVRSSAAAVIRSSAAMTIRSSAAATPQSSVAAPPPPPPPASSVAAPPPPPASSEPTVQARVIVVSADNFSFSPSSISAKKGEKVIIRVKGVAGVHGFGIPQLGINVRVEAGASVDVTLPTDSAGTFAFRCTIPCGSGHTSMAGTIVIS